MKKIPAVKSVMTAFPYWVDIDSMVTVADEMMAEHDISHLPVKDKGALVGVISMHDIQKIKIAIKTFNPDASAIREICVLNVYKVDLEEPLDNVLVHMSNHHIGSALVLKNDRLAGVFTMRDACRCFADSLRYQFRPGTGNDIA